MEVWVHDLSAQDTWVVGYGKEVSVDEVFPLSLRLGIYQLSARL